MYAELLLVGGDRSIPHPVPPVFPGKLLADLPGELMGRPKLSRAQFQSALVLTSRPRIMPRGVSVAEDHAEVRLGKGEALELIPNSVFVRLERFHQGEVPQPGTGGNLVVADDGHGSDEPDQHL